MKGLQVRYNESLNGIELFFEGKPDAQILARLKEPEHRFYWHNKAKKWYGTRTPERETFVNSVLIPFYMKEEQVKEGIDNKKDNNNSATEVEQIEQGQVTVAQQEIFLKQKPPSFRKNVLAEFYDKIGNDVIYESSFMSFMDFFNARNDGYFKDEVVLVRMDENNRYLEITDLSNAMQQDENVTVYHLSFSSSDKKAISLYLANELEVHTINDLLSLVREEKNLKQLMLDVRTEKGIDIFSPFQEIEPLDKMPQEWTKTHLCHALMSGQIHTGIVEYQCTSNYEYDMSVNAMKGKKVELPLLAKQLVSSWDIKSSIQSEIIDSANAVIRLSDYDSSICLYFDMNSDLQSSIEKLKIQEDKIKEYNSDILKNILTLDDTRINPQEIYAVSYLAMNDVTGKYDVHNELVQGKFLVDGERFHWWYELMKEISLLEIQQDKLYQVSSFFNQTILPLEDERFIPMGNHHVLVSGMALQELAKNMTFYYISENPYCGAEFKTAKEELEALVNGQKFWFDDTANVNYSDAMQRLLKEEQRVKNNIKMKTSNIFSTETGFYSLFHTIEKIENERDAGKSLRTYKKETLVSNSNNRGR